MRLTRNCLVAACAVSLVVIAAWGGSALAQEATATATPMMLPKIPQIRLQTVPAYGPAPLMVGFFVTSADPETVLQSYTWNFGDGQTSMLPPTALFHTYTAPGTYVVTVTASTADGHQASSFAGVIVTQPAAQ
ncbi:MAG: PKD domain-containing protein [Candidatus Binatus sp.]